MSNVFLVSDHHIGHANILTFKDQCGNPVRSFDDVHHMNEVIVAKHNSVVGVNDKVYFLGDVAFSLRGLGFLERMNGTKVLIKGNHDNLKLSQYAQFFKDVRSCHQLDKFILTHIPIHTDSLSRWAGNIHGHLHTNNIMLNGTKVKDPRYFNVSVEQIDYTPISLEEVKKRMKV